MHLGHAGGHPESASVNLSVRHFQANRLIPNGTTRTLLRPHMLHGPEREKARRRSVSSRLTSTPLAR
jgi:hypothetical protein